MIEQLSTLFTSSPQLFAIALIPLGLVVGSFLNVVIYRLPVMLERQWRAQAQDFLDIESPTSDQPTFNLATPASTCPHCNTAIKAWQNVPVISYLLLKGQCAHCSARISARYPLVELFTALLTAIVGFHFGFGLYAALAVLLTWCLVTLIFIDIDHMLLPDNITLPLLWLGLLIALLGWGPVNLKDALVGAMFGYLILWSVYWAFKLVTGKEGMGYGDFKLLAALGAWLGWQALPMVILISSVLGAAIGITTILFFGGQRSKPIPFGPYLAGAGWVVLIWGNQINQAYLNIY
ncbi:MAG: prepilin peptidase [Gammaproteobacteria bacterium]|nr:MAG: prepilin peptidase [Gammaproteobacteria bacterium]RLA13972.1 MAG: prepilin peptidase [Gammaproteobacteria bacterium]